MSIRVKCHTNVDNPMGGSYSSGDFPKEFVCRPVLGDTVMDRENNEFKICKITHYILSDREPYPILLIELTRIPFNKVYNSELGDVEDKPGSMSDDDTWRFEKR